MTEKVFSELTVAEQRVSLAQDVLVRLRNGSLQPKEGVYVVLTRRTQFPEATTKTQLQQLLPKFPPCEVCALGALFISLVAAANACTVGESFFTPSGSWFSLREGILLPRRSRVRRDVFYERLVAIFGDEVELIEAAFEEDPCFALKNPKTETAVAFGEGFPSAYGRLVAIMENIIANEGFFRP